MGCGAEEEKEDESVGAAGIAGAANTIVFEPSSGDFEFLLTSTDFESPGADSIEASSFEERLLDNDFFQANYADSVDSDSEPSCLDEAMDENVSVSLSQEDHVLVFEGEFDAIECFNASPSEEDSAVFKIFGYKICQQDTIESVEDKKLSDLDDFDLNAKNCGEVHSLFFMVGEIDNKFTVASQEQHMKITSKSYFGQSVNEPCVISYDGDDVTTMDCTDETLSSVSVSVDDGPASVEIDFDSYTQTGVQHTLGSDQNFYSAGSVAGTINNWDFTVNHQGAETAPEWTGTDGETELEKTYVDPYAASSSLRQSVRSKGFMSRLLGR
jgi:hypothetical protein